MCVCARVYTHQKVRSEASLPGEQTAPAVTPVLVYPAYRYDNLRNAVTIATAESLALAPCEDQNREKDDDNAAGYQLKDVQITSQLQISESAIAPLVSRAINSRAEATAAISGCVFVCSCEGMTSFVVLSVMLEKYDSTSFHDRIRQKREFIHRQYAQLNYR